jgi:TM2 domain-containing membrane protein YozV
MSRDVSDKSRTITLVLAALVGPFGGHRFYVGRVGSGIAMALTVGGLGIWYLYDLVVIAGGGFRDAEGRLVSRWEAEAGPEALNPQVLDELDALRAEVAELAERVDFTERLLANPRRDEPRE